MTERPFSQACENNKGPILEVLRKHLVLPGRLLEIGSGTGQHAAWLPQFLPHVEWQPSDVSENLPGIRSWLEEAPVRIPAPLALDVDGAWPDGPFDFLFTANTLHIMSEASATRCLSRGASLLPAGGLYLIYGPFHYDGAPTARSNADFDAWLRARDPRSGIRDQAWVRQHLARAGMVLVADESMPANNRLLVFRRESGTG